MNALQMNAVGRCRVSPSDRGGRFVVVADVAKDFAEIVDGGKDAAGDDLPLDLGEPDFDLVQPRRIGRGKVQVDLGMSGQEIVDEFGFVRREIVEDDVDVRVREAEKLRLGPESLRTPFSPGTKAI